MKLLEKLRYAPLFAALAGAAFATTVTRDARAIGTATGRITGTVIEAASQAPVPGAAITVKGNNGVNKTGSTGEDGTFEIGPLPPETYSLTISYEGMKPIKRKVVVNADQATPVNIVWSAEVAQEETTVVEEERHLTNPDSPQTGQIYSIDRTNRMPITRDYRAVAGQIPGVTSGGGTSDPVVKGARSSSNRFLINGLDINDPVNNTSGVTFQQDTLESVQVITGGFEAKYNALGSIVAVQTKRGTNQFHGAASAYWAPDALVDFQTFGSQLYDGRKEWDYSQRPPTQGKYELNLSSQGPIVKDHLFFNVGAMYTREFGAIPAGPPRFVQTPTREVQRINLTGGITFVPVDAHRIHFEAFGDPATRDYDSSVSSFANASDPYSAQRFYEGGHRETLEWSWQASKHVATKVMVGFNQQRFENMPQGQAGIDPQDLTNGVPYSFNRPQHVNLDDGTQWWNRDFSQVVIRRRYQLDASVTVNGEAGGRHDVEFGVQTNFTEQRVAVDFTGGTASPGTTSGYGITYEDKNGGLLDRGLCDVDPYINPGAVDGNYTGSGCFERTINRSAASHQSGNNFAVYIQDRYKPKKWLTIMPGTRWDVGTVRVTDSSSAVSANGFGPRLSAIVDITNDSKTIGQVSYGRMTEMPNLSGVFRYDDDRRRFRAVERYNTATRQFEFNRTIGGPGGSALRNDRVSGSADEILVSLRRELDKGLLVRADYTYRYLRRQFETEEVNAVLDPTGTRTVGWVNANSPTRINLYGFNPRSWNAYSGLDLIVEARFKDLELQGGYTLSQSWGPASGINFDNPRMLMFGDAWQTGDVRHQIKTSTTWSFLGFTLGLVMNWRSGVAQKRQYNNNEGYQVLRTPNGFEPGAYYNTGTGNPGQNGTYSDVRSWTEFRSPDVLTANLMLSYDFYKLLNQHVSTNVQVNNVLALTTPTGVNRVEGSPQGTSFGLATTRQEFRSVTLGVRYEF
jgi:hypothetical protein